MSPKDFSNQDKYKVNFVIILLKEKYTCLKDVHLRTVLDKRSIFVLQAENW